MSAISPFSSSRDFQVWEYQVSHGHLLIRSPKSPGTLDEPKQTTNVDLHFWGVDYFELPRMLRGIEIAAPTREELERIEGLLKVPFLKKQAVGLCSSDRRFVIVAIGYTVKENQWDIFQSPIEFRSQFRREL